MLEGTLWDSLFLFAMPVAATGILEQLFNAADVAVIGHFTGSLGSVGMAAVGANSPIVGFVLSLFIGIALGGNVVIATALGNRNQKRVHDAVHTSIVLAIAAGLIALIIGELVARPLLLSLHVPNNVLPYAVTYLRVYLIGLPVILLYNFEAAIFRSIGQTKTPLIALTLAGIFHVLLNLFLVIVVKMNVEGVAISTVASNLISSLVLLALLTKTSTAIKVNLKDLRFYPESLREILRIGLPAGIQGAVFALANIIIQSAINSLGTTVMAASSAAANIEIFCYYLMNSFSQACTTFVGQNVGARQFKRCKRILGICLLEDLIVSATAITIVLLFGHPLLAIFNSNSQVIQIGYERLIVVLSAYVFSMCYELMSGYLRGFGISLLPAIVTTISIFSSRIVWIHWIFGAHSTFATVMEVYPVSLGLTAALILIVLLISHPARNFTKRYATI